MSRLVLPLVALALSGAASAGDFLQASAIQQGTLQLRADVAAVRSALSQASINPQTTLTTHVPVMLERVRAARAQAGAYRQKIETQLESAEHKRQAAEAEHQIQNLETLIQEVSTMIQKASAAATKLEEVAAKIEEILPQLEALMAGACNLPHASTTVVKGSCAIATCEKGWINADGNAANGCETPVR